MSDNKQDNDPVEDIFTSDTHETHQSADINQEVLVNAALQANQITADEAAAIIKRSNLIAQRTTQANRMDDSRLFGVLDTISSLIDSKQELRLDESSLRTLKNWINNSNDIIGDINRYINANPKVAGDRKVMIAMAIDLLCTELDPFTKITWDRCYASFLRSNQSTKVNETLETATADSKEQ
jgi:hypothetical protein